jgi:hypothetical protein
MQAGSVRRFIHTAGVYPRSRAARGPSSNAPPALVPVVKCRSPTETAPCPTKHPTSSTSTVS